MFIMNSQTITAPGGAAVLLATVSYFPAPVTTSLTGGILRVRDLDRAGAGFFHGFPVQPGARPALTFCPFFNPFFNT